MKEIEGNISVQLDPVKIKPAEPPYTYLGVAQNLFTGVKVMASATPIPTHALSLVAAHTLECSLKAFLSKNGTDKELKGSKIRHNLLALWEKAVAEGLPSNMPPPGWVERLSQLHDRPYHLRYSEGVHGLVLPEPKELADGIEKLLELVQNNLN
jgi:hypothetical protein